MDFDFSILDNLTNDLINKNNELLKQWENTLYNKDEKEGKNND